jgi:uncharacterized membrane protein YeaQ/YmgE (transglycosylase-associated protein family)
MFSLISLLILLIVAAICGSIGSAIAGYSNQGCLVNIAIGFIGAIIGSYLSYELHAPRFFYLAGIPVIWAILGAALFMAVIGAISGRKKK